MPAKIIVSYDGTANEDDAIALGRIFAQAGAEVALAYVRHTRADSVGEHARARPELLARGAALLGDADAATHVVTDRSTPEGLAALAEREQRRRDRLLLGLAHRQGPRLDRQLRTAPARGRAARPSRSRPSTSPRTTPQVRRMVAVGDGDGGARETAESLASGARRRGRAGRRRGHRPARARLARRRAERAASSLSSSAAHLIEIATCAVLALPAAAPACELGRRPAGSTRRRPSALSGAGRTPRARP